FRRLCLAPPRFGGLAVVTAPCGRGCLGDMSAMSSEEIRAAAETYSELGPGSPLALAVISMVLGIPISAIAVAAGSHPAGALGLIVVWMAIAVINLGYAISTRGLGRQAPGRAPG